MSEKNYVHMLCTQCKKIYTIHRDYKYFIGFVLVFSSVFMFIYTLYKDGARDSSTHIFLLILVLMFAIGGILLNQYKKKLQNCELCEGKNALIKLDTSEAQQIIKENNLSVPE